MPLLAKGDVTVHKILPGSDPAALNPGYESVVLAFGDTLLESEVPSYVLDAIREGTAGPIEKVTEKEAKEAKSKVKEARAEVDTPEHQTINASNADQDADKA